MSSDSKRLGWLRSGLFWRTFFLLVFLVTTSVGAWVASIHLVERTPRAQQLAAQVISIVTITRAALTHSAPDMRRELLFDLASNEGIRVYPLEESDNVEPLPENALLPVFTDTVRDVLGAGTRFAGRVNDVSGFWISFKIDDDDYWLRLDRERLEGVTGVQWLGWGAVALGLSLIGAVVISRLVNQPLATLTSATRAIALGQRPPPLPERGPAEIRQANRSFNQMVDDLDRVETDRAVILAGISHDLRTPLARMQLEVEMAHLTDDARQGMQSDLAQMDAIIAQFLEYARPTENANFGPVNLSELMQQIADESDRLGDVRVSANIAPNLSVQGNPTDLIRVFNNFVENARRYGKSEASGMAEISIACRAEGSRAVIEFADHGKGVPEHEIERLLRPFTRLDSARSQANGAGLGLAIVERIVKRHQGTLKLSSGSGGAGGGLRAEITLPRKG